LKEKAKKDNAFGELDQPHRWSQGSDLLGEWILTARSALNTGGQIDLRGNLPPGVSCLVAENQAPKHGGYVLADGAGRPIHSLVNATNSILVLASQNKTVNALRAFFGRRLPIWEGHVRDNLFALVGAIQKNKGDAVSIAKAV